MYNRSKSKLNEIKLFVNNLKEKNPEYHKSNGVTKNAVTSLPQEITRKWHQ